MAISDKTRKLLWGHGANRCALCRQPLTRRPSPGAGHTTILGEECHIVGRGPAGPRAGQAIPGGDIDGYENLILMCRNDHRLIDDQPEVYSVLRLLEIKQAHEAWANQALGSALPSVDVPAVLERMLGESSARCVERWQALGLARELAEGFARERTLGSIDDSLLAGRPVTVLVGDVGSGKSLAGERLHQTAIARMLVDQGTAPAPVWIRARDAGDSLEEVVDQEMRRLGRQGGPVALVVDGLDELGLARATSVLGEARRIAQARRGSRAVLTSRLVAGIGNEDERRQLPVLDRTESEQLINRVTGNTTVNLLRLPQAVQEAASRPLFSIALGRALAENTGYEPVAPGEVIDHLVRRAVGPSWETLRSSLTELAIRSLRRAGGSVRASDVVPPHQLAGLLDSRIVVEERGRLRFPLILFAQWFAAQGLVDGFDIEQLVKDLGSTETWRYSFAIAVATAQSGRAAEIMTTLAESDPGFAALVVTEAMRQHGGEESDVDDWREAANAVRRAEQAWGTGLGGLARLVAPLTKDGLPPLGARVDDGRLTTSWYWGQEPRDDVFELPADLFVLDAHMDYGPGRSSRVAAGSAWAWRWTHDELRRRVEDLLKNRRLPMLASPLEAEVVRTIALAALDRGSLRADALDVRSLLDLEADVDGIVSRSRRMVSVAGLRDALARHADAEGLLHPPWPGPDQDLGSWVWSGYSPARTRIRAEMVFTAALRAYAYFAEGLFAPLAPRMRTAAILPAIAKGGITFSDHPTAPGAPQIDWWLEPKRQGPSFASFELGAASFDRERFRDLDMRVKAARPEAADWLYSVWERSVLRITGPSPAEQLLYQWLWKDLQRLGWVGPGAFFADWSSAKLPILVSPVGDLAW